MVDIVDKALRMGEGHQLKKLENVAKAVNALEDEISALSDEELKGQTAKFKQRLDNGENLDKLMPEAFATVREVSKRTLGQRHLSGSGRSCPGPPSLSRPAHRRHHPPSGPYRRNEDR